MSRKNYDSDFCGSLPLHHINLIQPHGYLLVIKASDLSILQTSENASDIFGKNVQQVIGNSFADYIQADQADALRLRFQTGLADKVPVSFTIDKDNQIREYVGIVHVKEDYLIIEMGNAEEERPFHRVFQDLKYIMARINAATSVKEASSITVKELKQLSGFDRILMYQFDEEWNGTVIAEEMEEGMDSYEGLRFPASDIPRQARELYKRNPYRLIPAREYTPVRIYPVINPATHTFIDLSDCNLRAVPAVHLEYMANMKISASMSIRVMWNDKLWGLISCHHRDPKYLSYEMCAVFELLSSVISTKISSIQNNEEMQFVNVLQNKRSDIIDAIYAGNSLEEGLLSGDINIGELLNGDGIAIFYRGKFQTRGNVPEKEELNNLIYWLQSKSGDNVYHTSALPAEYDQAYQFYSIASGLLSIPINASKGEYVLVFRPEVIKTVNWGGNPENAINFEEGGKKYHPRNSFGIWQETVKQTSLPWRPEELSVADNLRSFIFEYTTKSL